MKAITFMAGVLLGMAAAATAMTSAYPDIPRRMARDTRRIVRMGKCACRRMFA